MPNCLERLDAVRRFPQKGAIDLQHCLTNVKAVDGGSDHLGEVTRQGIVRNVPELECDGTLKPLLHRGNREFIRRHIDRPDGFAKFGTAVRPDDIDGYRAGPDQALDEPVLRFDGTGSRERLRWARLIGREGIETQAARRHRLWSDARLQDGEVRRLGAWWGDRGWARFDRLIWTPPVQRDVFSGNAGLGLGLSQRQPNEPAVDSVPYVR